MGVLASPTAAQRNGLHILRERDHLVGKVFAVVRVLPNATSLDERGDELLPRLHFPFKDAHIGDVPTVHELAESARDV